ncbi:TPA: hypothetical protein R2K49_004484 [Raoultella ornithinolytica]|nr:hypothetical protein [Raoultella ornithinolytica]
MSIISVDAKELGRELAAWGVPHHYAILFLEKSAVKNNRVALHPFFFNDTEHVTSQRHWLAVNAAYWCCVYREVQTQYQQVEALASIRSMYYLAGSLGAGEIKALIQEWWRNTYELHKVPAPSYSVVPITFSFH